MKFERHKEYKIDGRFALDPNQTAMENLSRAMRLAALLVLRKKFNTKGMDERTFYEVREEIELNGMVHFIAYKVKRHRYDRRFDFLTNVISSAWSVAGSVMYRAKRRIEKRYQTVSMQKLLYENRNLWDILPDTGDVLLNSARTTTFSPTERLKNMKRHPSLSLDKLIIEHADYEEDCRELGIEHPLSFEDWVKSNATEDEWYEYNRRKNRSPEATERRLQYMRDYMANKRRKKREAEYQKFLEDPDYGGTKGRK